MSVDLPLGKHTPSPREFSPSVLVGVPRSDGRRALGLGDSLPFTGVDVWNAYELSWLDARGKPVVATAELRIPATSPNIVESKSLKLYLNSLQAARHDSAGAVRDVISADLRRVAGAELEVRIRLAAQARPASFDVPEGTCMDDLDVAIDTYEVAPALLAGSVDTAVDVEETLYSHLLKSNCPITGQPDWGTVSVSYAGGRIDPRALLRYIVSYRDHAAFHEHCVERMFTDIRRHCAPRKLTVFARYTRRGGIDVNPFRSDFQDPPEDVRTWRQ